MSIGLMIHLNHLLEHLEYLYQHDSRDETDLYMNFQESMRYFMVQNLKLCTVKVLYLQYIQI